MENLPVRSSTPLSSLSLDQSRTFGRKANMDQVGKAFETLFMQTILKSMRDAKIEGGLFDSEHEKPFQSMLDGAYSELSVKTTRLGLAEAINRQFSSNPGTGATGLTPKSPTKIPVNMTAAQLDALTNGLSNSVVAGQNLTIKSGQGISPPTGLQVPKSGPKFMTGD